MAASNIVRLAPGEVVRLIIESARFGFAGTIPGEAGQRMYFEVDQGDGRTVHVDVPVDLVGLTVERTQPAQGVPLLGDVWRDQAGRHWFGAEPERLGQREAHQMISDGGARSLWTRVHGGAHGPLELVWRPPAPRPAAESGEPLTGWSYAVRVCYRRAAVHRPHVYEVERGDLPASRMHCPGVVRPGALDEPSTLGPAYLAKYQPAGGDVVAVEFGDLAEALLLLRRVGDSTALGVFYADGEPVAALDELLAWLDEPLYERAGADVSGDRRRYRSCERAERYDEHGPHEWDTGEPGPLTDEGTGTTLVAMCPGWAEVPF